MAADGAISDIGLRSAGVASTIRRKPRWTNHLCRVAPFEVLDVHGAGGSPDLLWLGAGSATYSDCRTTNQIFHAQNCEGNRPSHGKPRLSYRESAGFSSMRCSQAH